MSPGYRNACLMKGVNIMRASDESTSTKGTNVNKKYIIVFFVRLCSSRFIFLQLASSTKEKLQFLEKDVYQWQLNIFNIKLEALECEERHYRELMDYVKGKINGLFFYLINSNLSR